MLGEVIGGKTIEQARERDRLVHHDHVVGQHDRRHQDGSGLVGELIGNVAQDGALAADAPDQASPARVLGDDPGEVRAVERRPVVVRRAGSRGTGPCRLPGRALMVTRSWLTGPPAYRDLSACRWRSPSLQ